jgi:alpha-L-fucosidase
VTYQPTWESVSRHEVPEWYHDAKLGIFLHWGLYSVPAWAPQVESVDEIMRTRGPAGMYRSNPYSEWYANSYRVQGSPTWHHHRQLYGASDYDRFRETFDRESADADMEELASISRAAGADYVVLTTKHHDGFTLWPSNLVHPNKGRYAAKRDLVGDLADAVRARGMRFGAYYSGGYDWPFNGAVMRTLADSGLAMPADPAYVAYAEAHVRELIDRYQPSILWNDIGWPGGGALAGLFADFYNAVPDGVINNRWAEGPARRTLFSRFGERLRGRVIDTIWPLLPDSVKQLNFPGAKHADFTTPEYHSYPSIQSQPWELTRGIGRSFAFNVNENADDYLSADELVRTLADVTSKNGRLLLGLGPDAGGTISDEQRSVTAALGRWLAKNGEAITGTRPYTRAEGTRAEVRYTVKDDSLYAIVFAEPGTEVLLDVAPCDQRVSLVGGEALATRGVEGKLAVKLPDRLPEAVAHVIRVTGHNVE